MINLHKESMKLMKKKWYRNKLDAEVRRIIRSRGSCARCRNSTFSLLQTAHIFSRKNLSVRWDLENCLCLCAGCHFWAHQNPVLFTEFVRKYLGELKYSQLKSTANTIVKWTLDELDELLNMLKKV